MAIGEGGVVKVDVLAVLDRQMEFTGASDYTGASDDHRDMIAARAVVVQLIDSLEWMTALLNDPGLDDLEGWKFQCKHWSAKSRAALLAARGRS